MWLSTMILLPMGIALTLVAADDSRFLSADFYLKIFRMFRKR
jgi:hypothetical protein